MNVDHAKFAKYIKDNKKKGLDMVQRYHAHVAELKGGSKPKKMRGKNLMSGIGMHGGSWSDFTSWVKGAANTVAKGVKKSANAVYNGAIKPGANIVYNGAIKPGFEYVKNKPLTALGHVANAAAFIPSPFSAALRTAGTAAATAGRLTGYGEKQKTLMAFN